ncbi:MAG: hypothetical protein H0W86_13040 [Armatimonadetes bacterium]|nr:hypothetical protein [Armatimonadota bacterium]
MKRFLMISTAAVVALACSGVAFGQPTITNLGTPGIYSEAYGVSGDGSVVVGPQRLTGR